MTFPLNCTSLLFHYITQRTVSIFSLWRKLFSIILFIMEIFIRFQNSFKIRLRNFKSNLMLSFYIFVFASFSLSHGERLYFILHVYNFKKYKVDGQKQIVCCRFSFQYMHSSSLTNECITFLFEIPLHIEETEKSYI